jgi:hypothetical protein
VSTLIGNRIVRGHPWIQVEELPDGNITQIVRDHRVLESIRMGKNHCSAIIIRRDGSYENLGLSENLLTNIGRDLWSDALGAKIPAGGQGTPATASTATSLTGTGSVWTASNQGTPQLGLLGLRVYAPVTNTATAPVYMNVGSNTTNVITGDQWWNATDGTGTTPSSTTGFILGAGGPPSPRFMALTTDAAVANATDTALASENNANGVARALATYTHTYGAATFTMVKSWSVSGTITALHKMGLFSTSTLTSVGVMMFETVLNQDATVGNGDTLQVTDTVTLSG